MQPKQMKRLFPTLFILLVLNVAALAQSTDSIVFVPDRPGEATPPDILTFEKFQIESGFNFENYTDDAILHENYLFPSVLLRFGLLKNAEARISTEYAYKAETDSGIKSKMNGLNPITLGTKIRVFKQKGLIPNLSVLINLTLPWYGNYSFVPPYLAPSVYLLMSNSVFDKLNICYNIGLIRDGNESPTTRFCALSLGVNPTKKLGLFVEGYGFSGKYKRPSWYADAGLSFLINKHLQIDVSGSKQLNLTNEYYFVNAGIAWQLTSKKLKF